jgi:predicted transposase YbfD/YdcC
MLNGFLDQHRQLIEDQVDSYWSVNQIRHWLRDEVNMHEDFNGLEISDTARQIFNDLSHDIS